MLTGPKYVVFTALDSLHEHLPICLNNLFGVVLSYCQNQPFYMTAFLLLSAYQTFSKAGNAFPLCST